MGRFTRNRFQVNVSIVNLQSNNGLMLSTGFVGWTTAHLLLIVPPSDKKSADFQGITKFIFENQNVRLKKK